MRCCNKNSENTVPYLSCCRWGFPPESTVLQRPHRGKSCRHRAAAHRPAHPVLQTVNIRTYFCTYQLCCTYWCMSFIRNHLLNIFSFAGHWLVLNLLTLMTKLQNSNRVLHIYTIFIWMDKTFQHLIGQCFVILYEFMPPIKGMGVPASRSSSSMSGVP